MRPSGALTRAAPRRWRKSPRPTIASSLGRGAGFAPARVAAIRAKWSEGIAAAAELLENRRASGKVRRCHGDLHLRNICLLDGEPLLFDCLEFSDALASIDILYDLAFLVMDLEHRGLPRLANQVLNRYLDRTGEDDGLTAMPLFLSLRAGIRAHVTATALAAHPDRADKMAAEARRYLDLAHRALEPQPARLVALGGLSGSGKSTLAAGLAPEFGLRPGARVLRSDVIRKLLLGVAPETRLPAAAYAPDITRRVYGMLRAKAAAALAAGYSAIIDAVSLTAAQRRSFAEIARTAGTPFSGLWLEAAAATMTERIPRPPATTPPTPPRRSWRSNCAAIRARSTGPASITSGGPQACLAAARGALGLA